MYSVAEPVAPTRRQYGVATVLFAIFAVYGSLVPFQFRPLPFDEAVFRFSNVRYLQLGIASRADFVANILLFVPFGFLFMGALRLDRRPWLGSLAAAVFVVGAASALSVAIEFTQEFFPPRTVSLNDMFAETAGAAVGVIAWWLVGQRLTEWARAFARERQRPAIIVRLLAAYAALFFIVQLLPLDLTIDAGELAQKYREGRIVLIPFAYGYQSAITRLWDWSVDVALHVPIGAIATLGWTHGGRRRPAAAIGCGLAFAAVVELCQVFVFTRYADVTDVVTGLVGIAIGVAVATRGARRVGDENTSEAGARLWPVFGATAWILVILAYHWFPFDFVVARAMVDERLPLLLAAPFHSYYFGSEFHAFTEITRKFILAVPLGVFLQLSFPAAARRRTILVQRIVVVAASVVFFVGIEVGQIFLPNRIPDLTDVGIGAAGVCVGVWLVSVLKVWPLRSVLEAQ
jgi:VanZ family protein